MATLRREEWLHLAKGLAVNQTERYPHAGDRTQRANLVVRNHPDRWAAYCMSCKTGGVVFKSHMRVTDAAPPARSTELTLPSDMRELATMPTHIAGPVYSFLLGKNVAPNMLPTLYLSEERGRLLINWEGAWLGRDLTDKSHQKWLTYRTMPHLSDVSYGQSSSAHVLVEDPLSFFKVRWVARSLVGVSPLCLLGTGLRPATLLHLVRSGKPCVLMLDGDKAGRAGAKAAVARLRGLGVRAVAACAPEGHDPKDMTHDDINQHIQEAISWMQD